MSDLLDPTGEIERPFDWEAPLRRLTARHDVVVVEVLDPRELELPPVGQLVLVDPESGRQREVGTGDLRVRTAYAEAAAAHRAATAEAVRAAGAGHLLLRTDTRLGRRTGPLRPRASPAAGPPAALAEGDTR